MKKLSDLKATDFINCKEIIKREWDPKIIFMVPGHGVLGYYDTKSGDMLIHIEKIDLIQKLLLPVDPVPDQDKIGLIDEIALGKPTTDIIGYLAKLHDKGYVAYLDKNNE